MNFSGMYDVRDMQEADKNFILATFLRGLYYGDTWFSLIPKDIFMTSYKVVANALLDSSKTSVKVACLKEDPGVILGYSILSKDFQGVHYAFVKSPWRKRGIAKALVPKYASYVTHLTPLGKSLLSKFETRPIFNPFKL